MALHSLNELLAGLIHISINRRIFLTTLHVLQCVHCSSIGTCTSRDINVQVACKGPAHIPLRNGTLDEQGACFVYATCAHVISSKGTVLLHVQVRKTIESLCTWSFCIFNIHSGSCSIASACAERTSPHYLQQPTDSCGYFTDLLQNSYISYCLITLVARK